MLPSRQSGGLGNDVYRDVSAAPQALIKQRECVAQGAVGQSGQQQRRLRLNAGIFLAGNVGEAVRNIRRCDPAEIKPLAAG